MKKNDLAVKHNNETDEILKTLDTISCEFKLSSFESLLPNRSQISLHILDNSKYNYHVLNKDKSSKQLSF